MLSDLENILHICTQITNLVALVVEKLYSVQPWINAEHFIHVSYIGVSPIRDRPNAGLDYEEQNSCYSKIT